MKIRRMIGLLCVLALCLSVTGVYTLPAAAVGETAAGAARDPLPDGTIFVQNTWTPANLPETYTVDGKTFSLAWGVNAFAKPQAAVDAAPKYGTVYLCAGGQTESFTVKKSLTILGAKYGIDPNVRGAKESDPWTLNPERGVHETMMTGRINLGADATRVYDEAPEIIVDGLCLGGKGDIYSYNGLEGEATLTLKNIYVSSNVATSYIFFLAPYQPSGFSNAYRRYVTMENVRVEGLTEAAGLLRLNAERADISGVYMDAACTAIFLADASASNGPDDEVVWNIHDNMFAATVGRGIYLNWDNPSSNGVSLSAGVAARSRIVNNVYNNIFVNNYPTDSSDNNSTLSFRLKTENVYFNIENNAFYQTREPLENHQTIGGYCDYAQRKNFSDQITIRNNRMIGHIEIGYYFKNNTTAADVSGNYVKADGAVTSMPLHANSSASETWHWRDEAMTLRSDTDPAPASDAAPAATSTGAAVASETLPDRAKFVDLAWTSASHPASITVRGKSFALSWGVNAFGTVADAMDTAHRFDTVYLCPGTYGTSLLIEKSITLLGAKYGVNPNVKSRNGTDNWAKNEDRGSGETILSAVFNLGANSSAVYADATHITLDGVTISGAGQLRSNNGTEGSAEITLKNICISGSTLTDVPLYLLPYWPKSFPNTYRRFVKIRNLRVEGQTGAAVLGMTAERADVDSVYMDDACTKALFSTSSASNGPSSAARWSVHNSYFARTMARIAYFNWDNPSSNSVSLSAGVPTRSKVVGAVYNNYFAGTLDFRIKTENAFIDIEHNVFDTTTTGSGATLYGYTGTKLDYSDQITVKNNVFIDCDTPYYFKNTSAAVDISGNCTISGGAFIAAPTPENSGASQTWYWTNRAMTRRSDETRSLRGPEKIIYQIDQLGTGRADGMVTVTLPVGHNAEDIYLYWADENGRLPGYTALAPFKVSGIEVNNRMRSGTVIPQGATRLRAYTFSAAEGMSEEYAEYILPQGAALAASHLGTFEFEFQSVGDIHVTRTNTSRFHHSEHLRSMMEDILAVSPDSVGIFNNGDTADRGTDADYEEFLNILSEYPDGATVYSCIGNHEMFRFGLPIPDGTELSSIKQAFFEHLSSTIPQDASFSGGSRLSSLSFSFWKNGHKFIFLGTDVLDQNQIELNSTTLAWLKDQLDEDRDPTRAVFIIMHQQMADVTEDRSYVRAATETALRGLLVDYPEVIMFNGHTHSSLYEELGYYQGDEVLPSTFNCSSVGYVPKPFYRSGGNLSDSSNSSEGYYVYVYEDKVVVKGRDFLTGEWIASAQYIVDLSDEGPDITKKTVKAPYYGQTTADPVISDGKIGGTVTCFLPAAHNATAVALFFANKNAGIIGSQPFAVKDIADSYASQSPSVGFAEVSVPADADCILAYSYSDTLGWSANCDVIDLAGIPDSTAALADGNVSESGRIKTDKKVYRLGEPIYVTATMETEGDWVGMQLASVTSGSFLNYQLTVAGSGNAVDITRQSSLPSWGKFQQVTAGVWQIGWIPNGGATFQTAKTAENLITISVVDDTEPPAIGTPTYPREKMFSLDIGEVTVEEMERYPGKYQILWPILQGKSGSLWTDSANVRVMEYGICYSPSEDALTEYISDALQEKDLSGYDGQVAVFTYASDESGLSRVYSNYSFLIRKISPNRSRFGAAYIVYEYDGEEYREFSEMKGAMILPHGYIHGTGPTIDFNDMLDD